MDKKIHTYLRLFRPINTCQIIEYSRCVANGKEFGVFSATSRNSRIFYCTRTDQKLKPALIRSIFTFAGMEPGQFYLVIHCHQQAQNHPILDKYPQFGATFWSKGTKNEPEILLSSNVTIHGAFACLWDHDTLIMKPVMEVSDSADVLTSPFAHDSNRKYGILDCPPVELYQACPRHPSPVACWFS